MLNQSVQSGAIDISIFLILLGIAYLWRANLKSGRRLPPGPSGLPLLGNVLQIPTEHSATYLRHVIEEYGNLVSLKIAGFTVILIGDMKTAKEVLEKRSVKHSSRPMLPYFRKHVDPENYLWAFSDECESHSLGRKLTAGVMSLVRAGKTEPLQEHEAALNVQHLLDDGGKDWFNHIKRVASSTVLTVSFGLHCPTGCEPELKEFYGLLPEEAYLVTPTASITNIFPFLDFIPWQMPWRTRAQSFRRQSDALYDKLIQDAVTGDASEMNTWAAFFAKEGGDQGRLVRQFTSAAIETTTISLHTFVLACILYPDWIAKAQREIDNVVGLDRLPTFKDRPFLPYVEAVVRVRFGIPHRSIADDVIEYQGGEYFIPKDSVIIAVTWAIEHDQSRFKEHDRFIPDRFLDSEGKLERSYETSAFGFGRRVCPGIPFAERTLWINIAAMLWTFDICPSKEVDPRTGLLFKYDDSDAAFNGDLTNSPLKFPAVFKPRSPQRVEVARREWSECEKDLTLLMHVPKDS